MSITAARLQTEVDATTTGFDRGMSHVDQRINKSVGMWGHALSTGIGVGLERAAEVGLRAVAGALSGGLNSLKQQGVVVAQTNAVIKSTGGVARVTAAEIRDLSTTLEDKTAIDDKLIQADANLLLTFTNVRNEAGKGNDIFTQSVAVFEDMKTAMPSANIVQLGKALNDPLKGMTALTKVGVTFDDQQKARIKQYMAEGKVADAQRVILAELNKEFGGSGAAFSATDAGQAAHFQDAIEGVQQTLARGFLPVITRVRGELDHFLRDPATLGQVEALGNAIAGIFSEGNIKTAASVMTTAAQAVSTAIGLFSKLPPQVQALAIGAVALNKITGISPLDIVKTAVSAFKGVLGVQAAVVNVNGAVVNTGGLPTAAPTGALTTAGASALAGIAVPLLATALAPLLVVGLTSLITTPEEAIRGRQASANARRQSITGNPEAVAPPVPTTRPGVGNVAADWYARRAIANAIPANQRNFDRFERTIDQTNTVLQTGSTALVATAVTMTAVQTALRQDFRETIAALRKATTPAAIVAAVNALTKDVRGGVGNVAQTKALVEDLTVRRNAALKAGDKTLAAELDRSIKSIAGLLPGRAHQTAVLAKADRIVASNDSTKTKIEELKGLQREMTAVGRTTAANIIQSKIDIVAAVDRSTAAIKNIRALQIAAGKGPTESDSGPSGSKPRTVNDLRRRAGKGQQQFATGAYDVPSDMTAGIHKGEMIIPAVIAKRIRKTNILDPYRSGNLLFDTFRWNRIQRLINAPIFNPNARLDPSQIIDRRGQRYEPNLDLHRRQLTVTLISKTPGVGMFEQTSKQTHRFGRAVPT